MSKTLDYVIIFCAGLTAGVLCTKEYWKSTYKTRAEEEIESVKHIYNVEKAKIVAEAVKKNNQKKDELSEGYISSAPLKPRVEYAEPNEEVVNYGEFYSKEEVSLEEKMARTESPKEFDEPYLISEEEYSDTNIYFDKMSCTFYVPDRVVVDDLSREAVEPEVIGEKNIEYLIQTDEPLIYIRNENLSCDLEISKQESSIEETGDQVWFGDGNA